VSVDIYYVHTDHLNSPRRITRSTDNTIVWRWSSDPFGNGFVDQDPDGDGQGFVYNLRFPGQYADGETGLSYNYNRDYDPNSGRYVESDPLGLKAGINTYTYVENNPLGSTDPLGLVKRGTGWSGPQWALIKQAENKIRQQLNKACSCTRSGSTSCIPCQVVPGLLNALNNSAVIEASLFNEETQRSDCGVGGIGGTTVYLSPAAFTKSCGCLASTLYHELLHNAGLEHEASAAGPGVNDLEQRCAGNLCGKGAQ
jgi:RHS repeat-associated protein